MNPLAAPVPSDDVDKDHASDTRRRASETLERVVDVDRTRESTRTNLFIHPARSNAFEARRERTIAREARKASHAIDRRARVPSAKRIHRDRVSIGRTADEQCEHVDGDDDGE